MRAKTTLKTLYIHLRCMVAKREIFLQKNANISRRTIVHTIRYIFIHATQRIYETATVVGFV